jgi:hypothetical protein
MLLSISEAFSLLESSRTENCSSTQSVENIYLFRLHETSFPDYKSDAVDNVMLEGGVALPLQQDRQRRS